MNEIFVQYITPAISQAGWNLHTQIREEVTFTKGRVIVKGQSVSRGKPKRADYILYYKQNIPIAVIEAKKNTYGVGEGMQQALGYAETLDIPFVYSSNGDAFLEHDRSGTSGQVEREIAFMVFLYHLSKNSAASSPKLTNSWHSATNSNQNSINHRPTARN